MLLSHEHVGSKISAKIKIYIFTRAELLIALCYETPCKTWIQISSQNWNSFSSNICHHRMIQITPIISRSKTKWYKHQKNQKLTLNSQLQTYQILTNDDQMLILCLSYFITTVPAPEKTNDKYVPTTKILTCLHCWFCMHCTSKIVDKTM